MPGVAGTHGSSPEESWSPVGREHRTTAHRLGAVGEGAGQSSALRALEAAPRSGLLRLLSWCRPTPMGAAVMSQCWAWRKADFLVSRREHLGIRSPVPGPGDILPVKTEAPP